MEQIEKTRSVQRKSRTGIPLIAVVGYTNAGKSALVNALTYSTLDSENKVFTSLDPHMRRLILPSFEQVVIIDTVGFISDLPFILQTAFKSTLEEVTHASMILHVRDVNHPEFDFQKSSVLSLLKSLNLKEGLLDNHLEIWNKIDLLTKAELEKKISKAITIQPILPISALHGIGISDLLVKIEEQIYPEKAKLTKEKIQDKKKELEDYYNGNIQEPDVKQMCEESGIEMNETSTPDSIFNHLATLQIAKPRRPK